MEENTQGNGAVEQPPVDTTRLMDLPTIRERIKIDPHLINVDQKSNSRAAKWSKSDIEERGQNMDEVGQLQPVWIMPSLDKPGTFDPVFGYGRILGGQWLDDLRKSDKDKPGRFELDAYVVDRLTPEQLSTLNAVENLVVRGMGDLDIAIALTNMLKTGLTENEVLVRIGRNPKNPSDKEWFNRHVSLMDLAPRVHVALNADTFSVDAALALTLIKKNKQAGVLDSLGIDSKTGLPPKRLTETGKEKTTKITARDVVKAVEAFIEADPSAAVAPEPEPTPEPTPEGEVASGKGKKGKKGAKKATKKAAKKAASTKAKKVRARSSAAFIGQLETICNSKKFSDKAKTLAKAIIAYVSDDSQETNAINIAFADAFSA